MLQDLVFDPCSLQISLINPEKRCFKMMISWVSCPRCGELVDPQTRTCQYCGASLALAALLAERALTNGSMGGSLIPMSPEILVPRLGDFLIERGILKPEDLQKALDHQEKLADTGQPRLIGQTLLELGLVEKESLEQVITEQILQLQFALQKANNELEDRVRKRTVELENALNRLTELNQLKSNFIANISHELRTPLTHIKGYVELLIGSDLGPLTTEQSNALGVMKKSEERLEQLIEDLIQFSLVARGELDLKIDRVNLGDLMAQAVSAAEKKCAKAHLSLDIQIPNELPYVRADIRKMGWVVDQLMDNAIKFTPENGRVELGVRISNKRIMVSVMDTGIGIESERLEEIFEPFHQLDSAANRRYSGTGLGLAMVKQIIESHGSVIRVKSILGGGSTFEFSLPIE